MFVYACESVQMYFFLTLWWADLDCMYLNVLKIVLTGLTANLTSFTPNPNHSESHIYKQHIKNRQTNKNIDKQEHWQTSYSFMNNMAQWGIDFFFSQKLTVLDGLYYHSVHILSSPSNCCTLTCSLHALTQAQSSDTSALPLPSIRSSLVHSNAPPDITHSHYV